MALSCRKAVRAGIGFGSLAAMAWGLALPPSAAAQEALPAVHPLFDTQSAMRIPAAPELIDATPLEGPEFFSPTIVAGETAAEDAAAAGDATADVGPQLNGAPILADPFNASSAQPGVLRPPDASDAPPQVDELDLAPEFDPFFQYPHNVPAGFTGRSGVAPRETQQSAHFVPIEDRWRIGVPEWDRYDKDHPITDDYPYDIGRMLNPYKQNVLKGDFPIIGQHTFLNLTVANVLLTEFRQIPTPQNPFEVALRPDSFELFGDPDQILIANQTTVSLDLSHGDSSFKPADWRIRLTPVFNENFLDVEELGIISPDVTAGHVRYRTDIALQEWFVETKICDLSADYDFMSLRVGSQPFVSDFRGFLFADTNRAIRLFGTRHSNREQFNVAYFSQLEKQTNSFLNTWEDRHQDIWVANYFRQDTFVPGYTALLNVHYVHDSPTMKFDDNGFLVRPDPAGIFQQHAVRACYLGWGGDGHVGPINITHQFYQALGQDSNNPIAGREVDINAQMFACELSRDYDWVRVRGSYFYASGENDPNNDTAHGFDTILDNPAFAGGQFSYWQRQGLGIFGVQLVNRFSLVPDLRSSRLQGQPNFMNPGVHIISGGFEFEITQKFRILQNVNCIWFDETGVLEQFIFQTEVRDYIGTDISVGGEYRPLLSNNIIFLGGIAALVPGNGLRDVYNSTVGPVDTLFSIFLETTLLF